VPGRLALRAPAVLREREFRLLYAGQTVSVFGDAMLNIAISFAVLDLTGSVTDVGLVLAAARLPIVVTVLVGGVVADRVSRRSVMVVADVIRALALGATAVLLIGGSAEIWQLVVLQAIVGTATGSFYPAATGLLPLIVGPELLQQANGFRAVSDGIARIAGPVVAGLIVVASSPGWAVAVDAATFVVSAASLAFLRLPLHVRPPRRRFLHDLADGWTEFTSRAWVWLMVVVAGAGSNLFSAGLLVLGPAVAREHLGGPGAWAAIIAGLGAGGLAGALLVLGVHVRRPLVAALLLLMLFSLPAFALAALLPVALIVAAAFAAGISQAFSNTMWETTLQRHVPQAALSRVSSYDVFGSLVFNPLGLALAGPVAAATGTPEALVVCGSWFVVAPLVLVALPSIRDVRDD
jgi:MFS family permease